MLIKYAAAKSVLSEDDLQLVRASSRQAVRGREHIAVIDEGSSAEGSMIARLHESRQPRELVLACWLSPGDARGWRRVGTAATAAARGQTGNRSAPARVSRRLTRPEAHGRRRHRQERVRKHHWQGVR